MTQELIERLEALRQWHATGRATNQRKAERISKYNPSVDSVAAYKRAKFHDAQVELLDTVIMKLASVAKE